MEREPGIYDYEIETKEDADIRRELFKRIVSRSWVMLGLRSTEMTLEDIFLKITMGDNVVIKTKQSAEEKTEKFEQDASGAPQKEEAAKVQDEKAEEAGETVPEADREEQKEDEE